MHAPTPPTPIPVMITGPDDSPSRRESINNPNDQKIATFYTHDEVLIASLMETKIEIEHTKIEIT